MTRLNAESAPRSNRSQARSAADSRRANRATTPMTSNVSTVTASSCQKPCRAYSAEVSPAVCKHMPSASKEDSRLDRDEPTKQEHHAADRKSPLKPAKCPSRYRAVSKGRRTHCEVTGADGGEPEQQEAEDPPGDDTSVHCGQYRVEDISEDRVGTRQQRAEDEHEHDRHAQRGEYSAGRPTGPAARHSQSSAEPRHAPHDGDRDR